ncbi:iron ABC transporter ATP-binding protein [methanogenic archaeon mixed culture ISO4-G1]|nr:iron ABC transporter ATP-binding protein [methanogenic archaeon mixed culture ISO4-G1]
MKLKIEGLAQGYQNKTVIHDIDMEANSGEVVTILGPNGAGKSTLIKTICNVMRPVAGRISIDGRDITDIDRTEYAKIIGYVPQTAVFFGSSSVYDNVLIGRRPYVKWSYSDTDIQMAADAMIRMKVDDLYDRPIHRLSGGQRQRVTLARALAQSPSFYVFDEPTSALDLRNQLDTLKVMRQVISENNACMIIALHDLNLAYRYSDKVLVLKDGTVYAFGDTEDVITPEMIGDVYGVDAEIVEGSKGKFIHSYDSELDGL